MRIKRQLLLGMILVVCIGCGDNDPPVSSSVTLTADEQVLLNLDCYDPMYKVDANGRVVRLRMNGLHLPPTVMAEIGKLTELHNLDLYGSTVDDDGLEKLQELQNLHGIGLGGTSVSDKGLTHLEKLTGLRHVWLPNNRVSKAGVEKLKEACPELNVWMQ